MRNFIKSTFYVVLIFSMMGVLFSACTSDLGTEKQVDPTLTTEVFLSQDDTTEKAPSSEAEDILLEVTSVPENITDPTIVVEVIKPKTGLEATDPATVDLASGDIQLVEFFAFW
jgi:hypothetical protein